MAAQGTLRHGEDQTDVRGSRCNIICSGQFCCEIRARLLPADYLSVKIAEETLEIVRHVGHEKIVIGEVYAHRSTVLQTTASGRGVWSFNVVL